MKLDWKKILKYLRRKIYALKLFNGYIMVMGEEGVLELKVL